MNMPWWGGFDPRAWDVASLMDFAVPVGACLVFPWLRLYLSLVWLLIGYSRLSYVTALLLRPVFRRLEQPKDDPKKDGTDAS